MEYIKDLFIPDNKKCLNSSINLSEFLCVIGCCLVIACYVGHSIRDLFLNDPITPHKGTPIRLNHIIYGRFLDNITQVMSYTNIAITEFNYPCFQQRQIQDGWHKNMVAHFYPSWVSVIGESTKEWINRYTLPGWIFVPRKPHPLGNEYHTILCDKSKFIYNVEIMEGGDRPIVMGKKEFEEKGTTAGLMVRMKNMLWRKGKVLFMDIGLYVLEVLILMVEKVFLGLVLIKKRRYWHKCVTAEEILQYMKKKEFGDVDTVQCSIIGDIYHIMAIKETNYVMLMMKKYEMLEHL